MSYVVMLDAGHGGWDPGASYYGRQEKNDNLNLALAVGNILEQKGIPVIYTRTSDVYQTPFEKAEMANRFLEGCQGSLTKEEVDMLPNFASLPTELPISIS